MADALSGSRELIGNLLEFPGIGLGLCLRHEQHGHANFLPAALEHFHFLDRDLGASAQRYARSRSTPSLVSRKRFSMKLSWRVSASEPMRERGVSSCTYGFASEGTEEMFTVGLRWAWRKRACYSN